MKKRGIILTTVFLILICFVIFAFVFCRGIPSAVKMQTVENESYGLSMDSDLFYRQTLNNCGPYSVMAAVNVLKHEKHDPEKLADEMTWRIYKRLTFPQGVVDLLHKYKISTSEYVLKNASDEEKINFLKSWVEKGCPVILLIKVHHVLHYVTVLGYDEKGFMLYDSMQEKSPENPRETIIDEACTTGNRFYTGSQLLELWNAGGYKLFFRNWCIVCARE